MHPYHLEQLAQDRWDELSAMAQADRRNRALAGRRTWPVLAVLRAWRPMGRAVRRHRRPRQVAPLA